MRAFFLKTAALIAAAGLVLAGCGDLAGTNGEDDPKTLVIQGLPADWTQASAVIWDGITNEGLVAGGEAAVTGGNATVALKDFNIESEELSGAWTGSGDYYVVLWSAGWSTSIRSDPEYATRAKVSFRSGTVTVKFADIIGFEEWIELNGEPVESDRGEKIGEISGTITLTGISDPAQSVYISAFGNRWESSNKIDLAGVSGSSATLPWTLPLYEGGVDGTWSDITGTQTVRFYLYVELPGSGNNDDYRISLDSKQLDMTSKAGIAAGSLGTASLDYLTLSGTISVNNGGSSIPRVNMDALDAQGNYLSDASFTSPAANTPWSINIPVQSGGKVTFRVYGSDSSSSGGNRLFDKTLEPAATASVSNSNISGIVLDVGDISILSAPTGLRATASGSSISLFWDIVIGASSYGVYRSSSASGSYTLIGSPDSASYTDTGLSAGTYYYKVSALGSSGNESEQSSYVSTTVSEPTLTGSVTIGGTAQVGSTLTANTSSLNGSGSISYQWLRGGSAISGATGATYTLVADDEGSYIKVRVSRSGMSGSVESQQTGPVTGGGDSRPALTIQNDGGNTTVKVTSSTITNSANFDSIGGIVATGQGSFPRLTWSSGAAQTGTYNVILRLVNSPNTVKYQNNVSFVDGSATVNWNTMTEITGGGDNTLTGSVTINGTAQVGSILTANTSNLNGSGSISYQWLRGGSAISGATGATYTLAADDEGSYIKVRVSRSGMSGSVESQQTGPVTGGGGGGGDTLQGAKGKLTLTGFNEFNGKYVYSNLMTASGKYLIGTNGVELSGMEAATSMVRISGGKAEVPLYTINASGTTVADIYVPYEGSEPFQAVSIMIVSDSDGKFTASDAANFATNYAAMLMSNATNTNFTPSTSGGSITISRSDAVTTAEIMADYTLAATAKYMLMVKTQ
jgi:hypothetical protein